MKTGEWRDGPPRNPLCPILAMTTTIWTNHSFYYTRNLPPILYPIIAQRDIGRISLPIVSDDIIPCQQH